MKNMKNIKNKQLQPCSFNPITGYMRDGYCRPIDVDFGKHLVCARMNKNFLDFTEKRGNDLRSVVKEGDKWCLCESRYYEAYLAGKHPKVDENATHKSISSKTKKAILKTNKKSSKRRKFTKKRKSNKKRKKTNINKKINE